MIKAWVLLVSLWYPGSSVLKAAREAANNFSKTQKVSNKVVGGSSEERPSPVVTCLIGHVSLLMA
jgi:hypothetical protein